MNNCILYMPNGITRQFSIEQLDDVLQCSNLEVSDIWMKNEVIHVEVHKNLT